ncbi:MAG: DEAD/DEAH box helicase family protein [Spirochaetia bacterium]|jgi:type III restriction enzyme
MKENESPILNSPYEEPRAYYSTNEAGELDYTKVIEGRRPFIPDTPPVPVKQKGTKSLFDVQGLGANHESHLINLLRKQVKEWREAAYPYTTRITNDFLTFWFRNPDRESYHKLFFAQQEAVETAIWLNEVAEHSNPGQNILRTLSEKRSAPEQDRSSILPRIAFKMATGTGKTVVMAMFIMYHFFNRREYRNDTRFVDNFLIVTPGITIKERLGVLFVDTLSSPNFKKDYYHVRGLVPTTLEPFLPELNNHIVITNYHVFEPKVLKGNKRSPFDGKIDSTGKKRTGTEDQNLVMKRVLPFKPGTRLLIINDEAHHCYLPKTASKGESADKEENKRAAVWYSGLVETNKRFKVNLTYDLSATPYYLSGSGYDAYSLFPWVVSDFGLIESIESGLVKIPYLPESDPTQNLDMPVLRNLYEHVKDDLPKGNKSQLEENKHPDIPPLLKNALDQLYSHYKKEYDKQKRSTRSQRDFFIPDPVFIVVCNNTGVSSEVYRYIAGYEIQSADDSATTVNGAFPLFDNYDSVTKQAKPKPPTLLIDSSAIEDSEQIDEQFKKVFSQEIDRFKSEYCARHNVSSESLTDAQILREVVNTVGKPNELGSHIRCVVSVSMLTEGWDANTVTHVIGIRAFGSQLLCEQVAGRALRRIDYTLAPDGKLPVEYAMITGIPFTFFKGGKNKPTEPKPIHQIRAIPERQQEYEIIFPNVDGYRIETAPDNIKADFSNVDNYEIDGSKYPPSTIMASPISDDTVKLTLEQVKARRPQELIYLLTQRMIRKFYTDLDGNKLFHLFKQVKAVVEEWYNTKVVCIGTAFKNMLFYEDVDTVCAHINRGIESLNKGKDSILPVFNFYNRIGSTKYANGITTREVFPTVKSHVNYVVADTKSWEQIAAKTLEEMPQITSYVKNAFIGFSIPYISHGKREARYFPDFIARCKTKSGKIVNLVIEITGMNKEKGDKKHYVEHFWLPAINNVGERYGWSEWAFMEIADDIRDIRNQIEAKIESFQ